MIIDGFLPYTHNIKKYYNNSIKLLTVKHMFITVVVTLGNLLNLTPQMVFALNIELHFAVR